MFILCDGELISSIPNSRLQPMDYPTRGNKAKIRKHIREFRHIHPLSSTPSTNVAQTHKNNTHPTKTATNPTAPLIPRPIPIAISREAPLVLVCTVSFAAGGCCPPAAVFAGEVFVGAVFAGAVFAGAVFACCVAPPPLPPERVTVAVAVATDDGTASEAVAGANVPVDPSVEE